MHREGMDTSGGAREGGLAAAVGVAEPEHARELLGLAVVGELRVGRAADGEHDAQRRRRGRELFLGRGGVAVHLCAVRRSVLTCS